MCGAVLAGCGWHPRIWVTAESLARVRALAADERENALGWVPAEACAKILDRARELAQAGPYHYAVDMPGREGGPRKRWEYTLSDEPPPRHDDYSHYPPWTAMFQERADSITTRIKHFIFAYLVTGDRLYYEKAKEIVFHLCRWPIIWTDPSYGRGRPCLDTGHAAHAVGLFYDWCWSAMSEQERGFVHKALVEKALRPIDHILDEVADYHNYSAVITMGLGTGAIALLGEEPEAERWLQRCLAKMRRSFDAQGRDGGPFEGPGYGTYFASNYARFLWALHTAGVEADIWDHTFLRTLPRYCIGLMAPQIHRQPTFGDGGPTAAFPLTMTLLALRGDADAAWYLQQIDALRPGSIETLLLLDPAKIKPRQPTWNPSCCFVDIGYAALRDGYNEDAAYMAFKCGPPKKVVGHNHFDHNSFQIAYNGAWLATDPGYRSYFDPPKRKYTTSTFGHNSMVLNLTPEWLASTKYATAGVDQVQLARGRIARFFTSAALDYIRGDATETYNAGDTKVMERAWRDVVFIKPRVFVVRDTLQAATPSTFHWMLHTWAGQEMEVADAGEEGRSGTVVITSPRAALDGWVFSPQGVRMRRGLYKGAEEYGPWAMASTQRARSATITAVLVPRKWAGVVNGGFEDGMTGWTPRRMPGYTENHVIDEAVRHSGERSGRIDAPGGYYYSSRFPAPAGARLHAEFWARVEGAKTGATTCFYFWRGGRAFHRAEGPRPAGAQWRRYEFDTKVPEGTEEVCLALHFFNKQGRAWYDDVKVAVFPQSPEASGARVQALADGRDGVVVKLGEKTCLVVFAQGRAPTELELAGHRLVVDGEMGAVVLGRAGRVLSAWLLEGQRLAMDGRDVIHLPAPGTAAAVARGGRMRLEARDSIVPALPQ